MPSGRNGNDRCQMGEQAIARWLTALGMSQRSRPWLQFRVNRRTIRQSLMQRFMQVNAAMLPTRAPCKAHSSERQRL